MSIVTTDAAGFSLSPTLLVEGVGFEPTKAEPADLQSAPVDRLGTPPRTQAGYCGVIAKLSQALL